MARSKGAINAHKRLSIKRRTIRTTACSVVFIVAIVVAPVFCLRVKAPSLQFIIQEYDGHSTMTIVSKVKATIGGGKYDLYYLPQEFEIEGYDEANGWPTYIFEKQNAADAFSISVKLGDPSLDYDGDYIAAKGLSINGNDGRLYILAGDQCTLIWHIGDDGFLITGDITEKTMINIARSTLPEE